MKKEGENPRILRRCRVPTPIPFSTIRLANGSDSLSVTISSRATKDPYFAQLPLYIRHGRTSPTNDSARQVCCHKTSLLGVSFRTSAQRLTAVCGNKRIRTYSPIKEQIYSLPRLSHYAVFPIKASYQLLYPSMCFVEMPRVELGLRRSKRPVLPLHHISIIYAKLTIFYIFFHFF